MPRMNGIEFLEAIRADQALKSSIVFVFTTSDSDEDRIKAYSHNVAGYIKKGSARKTFNKAIEMLDCYWRVIEFPEN
jgi:DNA-binding NarL/FixJ family response regulator